MRKEQFEGISPILTQTAAAGTGTQEIPTSEPVEHDPTVYLTRSGDNLPALSKRFNSTIDDLITINPDLSGFVDYSTLPIGLSIKYPKTVVEEYQSKEQIIPDNYLIYGNQHDDFDVNTFLMGTDGWLKNYIDNTSGNHVTGAQIVRGTAENYSISPKLLIAILEYEMKAVSSPDTPGRFYLGSDEENRKTLGRQLSWAANVLNNGYYGWREGSQVSFIGKDGNSFSPHPGENAATVAIQYYFSRYKTGEDYLFAILPNGFSKTYIELFGTFDWTAEQNIVIIPENLHQPELVLPIQPGMKWLFTGGPHSGWGTGFPFAAIDFAPPSQVAGCDPSPHWAVAVASGIVAFSEGGKVLLDLDGDNNYLTGWVIQYLHLSPEGSPKVGTSLNQFDNIGHPSCLGGSSTGRNLHIARLYNGEWIPADGVIPMMLDGWKVTNGEKEYKGFLEKQDAKIASSSSGERYSQISAD
jgi:LysM repeat protein